MAARLPWARRAAAMAETASGVVLSGAEKEKLREKLALLRREYSETVSRLRRAQRAERAKSHGGKAAAEGARRPGTEEAPRSPAGCSDNISHGADRREMCHLQTETCSGPDTKARTSVMLKHSPEFFNNEVSFQDSSQRESTQVSQENASCGLSVPGTEEKKNQTSRSMMKLRRRTKILVSEGKESAHDVHLINADVMVKNHPASMEELQSPVFRRSSFSEDNAQMESRSMLMGGQESSLTPPEFGVSRDVPEDSIPLGVSELFPCALGYSNDVWQPESPGAPVTSDNQEAAQPRSESGESVSFDASGKKKSFRAVKEMDSESMCEDQGELRRLLDLMSENEVLPTDKSNSMINESKIHGENPNDTGSLNAFPSKLPLDDAEKLVENQELEIQSRLSPQEKVTAPESALNSCTVVEGLPFPVEYYVRTTRRMSNCQRKVDLDAVILSHLGRSKKGQRSKCKQKDRSLGHSSQETAENHLESAAVPFLCAEGDPVNSSPQKHLLTSSGSSTSPGSISQNSVRSTKRDQRQSQRKQKGKRKATCRPLVNETSQELIESLDLTKPRESSSLLSNEYQSEKENCEANLEKSSLDRRQFSVVAALGSELTGMIQPTSADPPGGSQVLGKCCESRSEQVQNPLQKSDSLSPGNETFTSHTSDLECNLSVYQSDKHPVKHVKNQQMHRACRSEQLLSVPLRRSLRSSARQRNSHISKGENKRRPGHQVDSEGAASLGLPAEDPDMSSSLFSFRSFQWLAPKLDIKDFHLPDEEFGLLKLGKYESSPGNDLEVFVPSVFGDGVASEDAQTPEINAEEKELKTNLLSPFKNRLSELPHLESPAAKVELSTHELLFTPMGTLLTGAPAQRESQISSSVFPVLGATPAVLPSVCSEVFPNTCSVPPLQVSLHSSKEAPAQVKDNRECKDSAIPLHLDSCGAGSARKEEEQGTTCHLEFERCPNNRSDGAVNLEKHQQSQSKHEGSSRASPEQKKTEAEQLTPVLLDGLREENLQFVSKLKDSSSSCTVDVNSVWWEAAGCRELCVVTACESSVSLWKPQALDCWEKVYTWQLGEIPVIQIIPLPDTCNLVCIALGNLEIGEIRLLLYSSENDSFKQSLVKSGNIKAVLGLKDGRLVSSSRAMQEQQVEIVSLSETGRCKDRQTLMPPEETVLAFAEVEGVRDALVGTTAVNSVAVWNLKTGQLLKKMHIGYSYPASICHRAYSDSGLLFVVLSHPHAKESESCGNPAFRVIAFNPKTARSTGVMFSSLPPGHTGRYLEGEVKDAWAAAVLTSGAIAVWDLLLGRCTALLPPGSDSRWTLVRWSAVDAGLLAGRADGSVCVYRYARHGAG
ncbi:partner and localizer of BRCA2 isoform X2 [Phasianus colchicus]|uniref:Partner and localiser of BRCA2 WD40 domain-containing protein n=1 Tax=Phasianus colchicus TaxID=9054 RepID=A0A669QVH2_PHACC|nr:partner and localizer of BRCA2 isoform X2 [Phasianus colchicus]